MMRRYVQSSWRHGEKVTDGDVKTGELLENVEAHEEGMQVTDLQMSSDRTYFITASKDKTAKVPIPIPIAPLSPKINKTNKLTNTP